MENLHLSIDYLMPEIKELILSIEEKMNCPRDFATTAVFASGAIGNRIQTKTVCIRLPRRRLRRKTMIPT